MEFGHCMGPVPAQHREENVELVNSGSEIEFNDWGTGRYDYIAHFLWLDGGSPPITYVSLRPSVD